MLLRQAQQAVALATRRSNALPVPRLVPVKRQSGLWCRRAATSADQDSLVKPRYDIKMLYDGECPLCMREVNMLQRRDKDHGRIAFVDIASPDYQPAQNAGISFEEAMGEIHAVLPSGEVVKNIEVFQRLYEAVGLGWVYGFTKYEILRRPADAVYSIWARYRLPLTGRSDMATVMSERKQKSCR